jgi:hypothetical protein
MDIQSSINDLFGVEDKQPDQINRSTKNTTRQEDGGRLVTESTAPQIRVKPGKWLKRSEYSGVEPTQSIGEEQVQESTQYSEDLLDEAWEMMAQIQMAELKASMTPKEEVVEQEYIQEDVQPEQPRSFTSMFIDHAASQIARHTIKPHEEPEPLPLNEERLLQFEKELQHMKQLFRESTMVSGIGQGGDGQTPGSGEVNLTKLDDVNLNGMKPGDTIIWDGNQFVPGTPTPEEVPPNLYVQFASVAVEWIDGYGVDTGVLEDTQEINVNYYIMVDGEEGSDYTTYHEYDLHGIGTWKTIDKLTAEELDAIGHEAESDESVAFRGVLEGNTGPDTHPDLKVRLTAVHTQDETVRDTSDAYSPWVVGEFKETPDITTRDVILVNAPDKSERYSRVLGRVVDGTFRQEDANLLNLEVIERLDKAKPNIYLQPLIPDPSKFNESNIGDLWINDTQQLYTWTGSKWEEVSAKSNVYFQTDEPDMVDGEDIGALWVHEYTYDLYVWNGISWVELGNSASGGGGGGVTQDEFQQLIERVDKLENKDYILATNFPKP